MLTHLHKHLRRHLIASGIALAMCSTAHGTTQPDQNAFKDADSDNNGSVSYSEAQQAIGIDQNLFDRADRDGTQSLSRTEYDYAKVLYEQQQQKSGQVQGQRQSDMQDTRTDNGTRVQIKEQAPQVTVTDQEPSITVEQKAPKIAVQQPPPRVEVQTPKPQVEFQQASPQVTVLNPGEPQVEIKQPGKPQVITQQEQAQSPDMKAQQRTVQQSQRGSSPSESSKRLMSMRVGDLLGMEVENSKDDDIGEVEKIVVDEQTNTLHAVVSVGGIMGIGDKKITMKLDDMQLRDDELVTQTSLSEDDLDNRPAYSESAYRELSRDRVLGEYLSDKSTDRSGSGDSFAAIDRNNDGQISHNEAMQNQMLRNQWQRADSNNDRRIDRAEFNAFQQRG